MFKVQHFTQLFAAVILLFGLAACNEKPSVNVAGPFHIGLVQAAGPSLTPQLQDLQNKLQMAAAHVPQTNNVRNLRIHIAEYHRKNAGLSLIVGDTNRLNVLVELVDPNSGAVSGKFNSVTINDYVLNGVIGAALAAGEDETTVIQKLNTQAANDIMERLYGRKTWHDFERMPARVQTSGLQ